METPQDQCDYDYIKGVWLTENRNIVIETQKGNSAIVSDTIWQDIVNSFDTPPRLAKVEACLVGKVPHISNGKLVAVGKTTRQLVEEAAEWAEKISGHTARQIQCLLKQALEEWE